MLFRSAAGFAGPATIAALHGPIPTCPFRLAWPFHASVGDRFGPRGTGFHPGIDLPAPTGTPVHAAAVGRVLARPTTGGYGNLVVVRNAEGVETLYAHLSRIFVSPGQAVTVGSLVGLVGATGRATGPHLHFEVRVRGAAVDPSLCWARFRTRLRMKLGAVGPRWTARCRVLSCTRTHRVRALPASLPRTRPSHPVGEASS